MTDTKMPLAKQPRRLVALAAVLLAIMGTASVIGWFWAGTTNTELAQWLMAAATMATLLAAALAAVFAAGVYRVESAREERVLTAEERAHAQTFAAWADRVRKNRNSFTTSANGQRSVVYGLDPIRINLRNGSDIPIHDITFKVRLESEAVGIDGAEPERAGNHLDIVPPRDTTIVLLPKKDYSCPVDDGFDGTRPMPRVQAKVAIQFKDSAGLYWRRHADGDLEKGEGELRC